MYDDGIPKHILEEGLGGRRPTGKLKNRWEGKLPKDGTKLLNMKNWHAIQDLGVIVEGIQEEMATNWAEEPQEEGYHKTVHSII